MIGAMVGGAGWILAGVFLLYARHRGWTVTFERDHKTMWIVVVAIVAWSAMGWSFFFVVMGSLLAAPVVPALAWRALEFAVWSATGFALGRTAARRTVGDSPRIRPIAALMVLVVILKWAQHGASAIPVAVALVCVAVVAFVIGARSHDRPASAAGE